MIHRYSVPDILQEVSTIFHDAGFSVYLVGGAVRDFLLKKQVIGILQPMHIRPR